MMDAIPQSFKIFLLTILVGGAAAWATMALRIWRGRPLLEYEPRRPVPWDWIDLVATFGVFLCSQVMCVALAVRWFGVEGSLAKALETTPGQLAVLSAGAATFLLTFLLSLSLVTLRSGADAHDLGFSLHPLPRDILYGIVGFFGAAPILYLMQIFFTLVLKIDYDHPLVKAIQQGTDSRTVAIALFAAVVVAPIAEEFLVRVLLQGWLEKLELRTVQFHAFEALPVDSVESLDSVGGLAEDSLDEIGAPQHEPVGWGGLPLGSVPILISSLIFALMHLGHGAAPVPLFFYALVLGYLYNRTHRIAPSIVAHFILNSASMVMLFLAPLPAKP